MRLLHAADLHLGKTLRERGLAADQAHMLEALLEALRRERPAALLLAGDIYDRSVPPPEAIGMLDDFLSRAAEGDPALAIVLIPGNHDSAARLAFGSGLLKRAGVHLRTRVEEADRPVLLERDGERCAIFALPYLYGPPSPAEAFEREVRRIRASLLPDAYNVLLAHCFAAGGTTSESERSFAGLAERVDTSLLDDFDYAALGHLHRPQRAGPRGRYPGSPLAYSFAEAGDERGFLVVELAPGGTEARFTPIEPLRRLSVAEGGFAELSAPGARPALREDWLEIRLTDPLPVLDPVDALRANFPYLLSVRQAAFELPDSRSGSAAGAGARGAPAGRGGEGPEAALGDFAAFHAEMRGEEADAPTLALFSELLAEAGREAP